MNPTLTVKLENDIGLHTSPIDYYVRIHQPKMIKMVSRWMIHLSDFVDVYRTHEIIGSLQYLSLTFHQKIGFCLSSTSSKRPPTCHRKTLGPGVPRGK